MSDSYPIKIWSGLLSDEHTQKIENYQREINY